MSDGASVSRVFGPSSGGRHLMDLQSSSSAEINTGQRHDRTRSPRDERTRVPPLPGPPSTAPLSCGDPSTLHTLGRSFSFDQDSYTLDQRRSTHNELGDHSGPTRATSGAPGVPQPSKESSSTPSYLFGRGLSASNTGRGVPHLVLVVVGPHQGLGGTGRVCQSGKNGCSTVVL